MPSPTRAEQGAQALLLATARESVAEARRLLILASPDAIEKCLPHIAMAMGNFALLERRMRDGAAVPPDFARQIETFSADLGRVAALLRGAGAFHGGLLRLMAAAKGRYGPNANLPSNGMRGRVSFQG